jgi:preprotein translocase SecE subunit
VATEFELENLTRERRRDMEDNKKAITVSFVAVGLLIGFVAHLLMQFLAQSFSFFARVETNEFLSNGIPVFVGALTFFLLQFNSKVVSFTDGVVAELRKVVWPSGRDTGLMTVVVVIFLVISGVVVGVYDSIWAYLINNFIK